MPFKFFLFFVQILILNEIKAQTNTSFTQTLLGHSFNSYNMGYTIDEINDVIYDEGTQQILLVGRAADEPHEYSPAVPWLASTKFLPVEQKRNLPGTLFNSSYIKNENAFGLSVYRLIKLSNNIYGLNGGIISMLHPGKWQDFSKNVYFSFKSEDYTHGFFEVGPDRFVPGYFYEKTGKFGLQMFDKNLNPNDTEGNKMGSWSWPNKKNMFFNMCPQADASGFHYAISTHVDFDESKVKVHLQKFKFSAEGIKENPVVSSIPIALPLKQPSRRVSDSGNFISDSTTTYIFDVFYDHLDPNHSIVSFNEKGNLTMIFHSPNKARHWKSTKREVVAFMEVTPAGKLVRIDTLCTFKNNLYTSLKVKDDGFGNYMVIYQRNGGSGEDDLGVEIKLYDKKTLALNKSLKVSMEKYYFEKLCDEKTLKNSLLSIHLGNIVAIKEYSTIKYFMILHVKGYSDKAKSRVLIAELTGLS